MIIGFSGGMGSGKSTAIETLEGFLKKTPRIIKFAGPLYDMQEYIYRRIAMVHERPAEFVKDRKLLQWLGTEWGRGSISQSIWVDLWKTDAFNYSRFGHRTVVSDDVRFDNEAEAIRSLGGYVIKIIRPDNTQHAVGGIGIVNHASEAGISKNLIDFEIINDDTVNVFQARLLDLYKVLEELELEKQKENK